MASSGKRSAPRKINVERYERYGRAAERFADHRVGGDEADEGEGGVHRRVARLFFVCFLAREAAQRSRVRASPSRETQSGASTTFHRCRGTSELVRFKRDRRSSERAPSRASDSHNTTARVASGKRDDPQTLPESCPKCARDLQTSLQTRAPSKPNGNIPKKTPRKRASAVLPVEAGPSMSTVMSGVRSDVRTWSTRRLKDSCNSVNAAP